MSGAEYKALPRWENFKGGNVHPKAVHSGSDENGEPLYVGRIHHQGDTVPGKVVPSHKGCYACYNGKEIHSQDYQLLVNHSGISLNWEKAKDGEVPNGALQGGVTKDGEHLFIARAVHGAISVPGKLHPSHKHAYVPYCGEEHAKKEYEVLVIKHIPL